MKVLKLSGLVWVMSLVSWVFTVSSADAFLAGENILGGKERNIPSVFPLDRGEFKFPSIFLDSFQVSALPQWAKDVVGATEFEEKTLSFPQLKDKLKNYPKGLIVQTKFGPPLNFIVVKEISTPPFGGEESVKFLYWDKNEGKIKEDNISAKYFQKSVWTGKVYLPVSAQKVEVPEWAQKIMGAKEFKLENWTYDQLKKAPKPVLVRWPKDSAFQYAVIDEIKTNVFGEDIEIKYRDEGGSKTMPVKEFKDKWRGDVLVPVKAEEPKLPAMDFVITDFEKGFAGFKGIFPGAQGGDGLNFQFNDTSFPERGIVLQLDYTQGGGFAYIVFLLKEKLNIPKEYKYLAIDVRGKPKSGSQFPAGQFKMELKQDPAVVWVGYTKDTFGDEWKTIYIPLTGAANWADTFGIVFEGWKGSASGTIYIDRIGLVKELPK
jgi:hypothetical protein